MTYHVVRRLPHQAHSSDEYYGTRLSQNALLTYTRVSILYQLSILEYLYHHQIHSEYCSRLELRYSCTVEDAQENTRPHLLTSPN